MDMDTEDLVDTNATQHINGTNNQWGNPFHLQEQQDSAKKALNMDGINFDNPPPPTSVPVKQNGGGERGAGLNHQDLFDMGPETDVDRLDESDEDETGSQDGAGRNPFMCGIDDEEAELRRIQQQQPEFDVARHPREETPTPPADQVPEPEIVAAQDLAPIVGDVENVAESGEESEDEEWKYFSVEPSKQAAQTFDQLLPQHQQEHEEAAPPEQSVDAEELEFPTADNVSELLLPQKNNLQLAVDEEDPNMDSQLNPNAAEFVPVSPTMESCVLPGAEDPLGVEMNPFKADLEATSTEPSAPAFPESGFEHHPMDFLSSADVDSDKENLVLQSSGADLDETLPSDHVLQQPPITFEAEEENQNLLNFCGTIPPSVCELDPFSNNAVEETQFGENLDEFEKITKTENMDIINNAPLSPVLESVSPVTKFEPEENLFNFEQTQEQTDLLVETPNFSVAQSPTFPVVENIITPDEESVASAVSTSPAVEEQQFEMNEPVESPSSPLLPVQAVSPAPLSPQPFETKSFSPAPLSPIPADTKSFSPVPLSPHPAEVMSTSPGPLSPQLAEVMSFSPAPLSPQPLEAKSFSPIPMSPEPVLSPVSPKQPLFPVEPEQVDLVSPVAEVSSALQENLPLSPVQDINLQQDILSPVLDDLVIETTATPPPTPAMPVDDAIETKVEEKTSEVEVEALAQVVEKLSVTSPEPAAVEAQPEIASDPEPKPDLSSAEIVTAALATVAVGAVAATVAGGKSSKPTSPTKAEAPKKPASPTKEKLSSVTKKTPTPASKVAPKTTTGTKAPVPAKTTTAAVKSTTAKTAPSTAKVPAGAKPAATTVTKKLASTAAPLASAKPKPAPSSATTRSPRPAPSVGATPPSKPLSARPKPPVATTTKPADAKKPLVNGDAAKTAPKRPVSSTATAKPLTARPTTTAPKPPGPAKLAVASATTAKTSPRPRPASAAVNGVAKPKPEVTSKVGSPRPASASASSTTTARRVVAAPKPATSTKQVKETANKQLSSTRSTTTTKTVPPTRAAAAKSAAAAAAAAAASVPAAKVPPIRKPTSTVNKTTTKAPPKESSNVEEVKVHMNGDSHPEVENGKEQTAGDGQQQEILLEVSSPCLVPVDAAAD